MGAPSLAPPLHEGLPQETRPHHQELQVEPVVREPEEEVGAEDDGKGAEAEDVALAPRPREQHIEGVGEHQLRQQQPGEVVDRAPIPPPAREHRELHEGLQVVLRAQDDLEAARCAGTRQFGEEHPLPGQQHGDRPPEREGEAGVVGDAGRK